MAKIIVKLIREKVAEQYLKKDKNSVCKLKTKLDKRTALADKVIEEAREVAEELQKDRTNKKLLLEELGDLKEVIDTILYLYDIEAVDLQNVQDDKYDLKGGFEEFYLRLKKT